MRNVFTVILAIVVPLISAVALIAWSGRCGTAPSADGRTRGYGPRAEV